jgi:hypothetical protein
MLFKSEEGSTKQLVEFCAGYFFLYTITGITVKYFMGSPDSGFPGMNDIQYLAYNTLGGNLLALGIVLAFKWYKLQSNKYVNLIGFKVPSELTYIIPSGICTAVVIPTTTLMYTLPISVMVAMVIMRGSIIVISRLIDAVQIKQGILKKRVYWEENAAVVFAVFAVAENLLKVNPGSFDFLGSPAAITILSSYIIAYSIRLYIMNYYKNTRAQGVKQDNKGFFAIEQIAATITLAVIAIILYNSVNWFGWDAKQLLDFHNAINIPHNMWGWAAISGFAFGLLAFFPFLYLCLKAELQLLQALSTVLLH